MGLFLRITYQSQGGRTPETAFKNQKILDEMTLSRILCK